MGSGVDEGDHDVSSASSDLESLMPVGQPARVHEGPAQLGRHNTTVVPKELAASTLNHTH